MRSLHLAIVLSVLVGVFFLIHQPPGQVNLRVREDGNGDEKHRHLFTVPFLQSIIDFLMGLFNPIGKGGFRTTQPVQMVGLNNHVTSALLTIGESSPNGYKPPGIPDGMAAYKKDSQTVRIFSNHEIASQLGYQYSLASGAVLRGARISYLDIDIKTRTLIKAGLAYDTIYNRAGNVVTAASDLPFSGLQRFCSAQGLYQGKQGFVDDIFVAGEETTGGTAFALDVKNSKLWAVPALGYAAFESVAAIGTGDPGKVALLIGDDRSGAGLLLYVGVKAGTDFLGRNGLKNGKLYAWKPNQSGILSPADWKGTGSKLSGSFVLIDYYRPDLIGNADYDALGYALQTKQDALLAAAGAFKFSRPEDLHTNPQNDRQVVFASTGQSTSFPSDSWGTTYLVDIDPATLKADLTILFDGDDSGGGAFLGPDFGIRSPDNVVWASDGFIYIQEDRSFSNFGKTSGQEASLWKLNPASPIPPTRIGIMDRKAVPSGQTDSDPAIGVWESSGVIDVTSLFGSTKTLLFFNVQAHGVQGSVITQDDLVEGGQYLFLELF